MIAPPKTAHPKDTSKKSSPFFLFAAVGVVVVTVVLVVLTIGGDAPDGGKTEKIEMVANTSPAVAKPRDVGLTPRKQEGLPVDNPAGMDDVPEVTTNAAGVISYKNGPKFVIPPPRTPTIFTNFVDSTIASALAIQPGEHVYLSIPDDFDKRFVEILNADTISASDDDTDETIQLKAGVLDVKKQLKERLAQGESPKKIMEDELKALDKLAETYNYFRAGLNDLRKSGASMQERQDYVDAANKVMEEYSVFKKMRLELDEQLELKREQRNAH